MKPIADVISPFSLCDTLERKFNEKILMTSEWIISKITSPIHIESPWYTKIHPIIERVKELAVSILKATISAFFYWVNPSLFAIGFITGIVKDDDVRYGIQKIKNVWKNQTLQGCLMGSFACFLSMPVTLATTTLLWSAHFGSLMHSSSDETTQMPPEA